MDGLDLKYLADLMTLCRENGCAIFEHGTTKLVFDPSFTAGNGESDQTPAIETLDDNEAPAAETKGTTPPYPANLFADGEVPTFDK